MDAVKARAAGLEASGIGSEVKQMISGIKAAKLDVNGNSTNIRVEYADMLYDSIRLKHGFATSV